MGLPENSVIQWDHDSEPEPIVTQIVVTFLARHDMAELAELFSFAELLQIANPFRKIFFMLFL